jgi:hypothetical protein
MAERAAQADGYDAMATLMAGPGLSVDLNASHGEVRRTFLPLSAVPRC